MASWLELDPIAGPSCVFSVLSKSGRGATVGSMSSAVSTEGAALTFFEGIEPLAPGRLRFNAVGTNAVASFLKSRNSGSAATTAAAEIALVIAGEGLGGKEGWTAFVAWWAWKV